MWWPLRRRGRGRHAAGRVVFLGANGSTDPAAPWDRADATALQAAWEALSSLDVSSAVVTEPPMTSPPPPPTDSAPSPPVASALPPPDPPRPTESSVGQSDGDRTDAVLAIQDAPRASLRSNSTPEPVAALPARLGAGPEVWLEFEDGSRISFEPDDPAAVALRAVANRLTAVGADG